MHVGREVGRPAWFALHGELGAGKSVLARAIARGAGVTAPMPSPTFNLVFQYEDRNGALVWHLDLYRLTGEDQVVELGWWDLGGDDEIVLIEWPERAASLRPADRWDLFLDGHPIDPLLRLLTAWPRGNPPAIPLPDPVDD
jgi:tRNA threonylcarbamoyladenosine biosynthesis protein TsaE